MVVSVSQNERYSQIGIAHFGIQSIESSIVRRYEIRRKHRRSHRMEGWQYGSFLSPNQNLKQPLYNYSKGTTPIDMLM